MSKNEMIKKIYPLSPMQEGMLFYKLLGKDKNAYFEQSSFRIIGSLEVELFEKSINKLIERHDVLRTLFIYEDQKRPRQVVLEEAKIKIWFEDISSLTSSEKIVFIKEFKEKDIDKGFNLLREISIRASTIKIDEENYIFILSFHHIILDGWSLPIIFNDLMCIYNAFKESMPLKLRKVNEYSNYIKWLEKQDKKEALAYWEKYLDGYEEQAQVSQIDKSFRDNKYTNSEIKFSIGRELTDKLKNVAEKNKITVNTIFQTAWGILLQRYNNVDDVVFGSVVSGRPAEIDGIENMVGLFINAIPVRIKNTVDKTFIELIKEVHECSIASKKYEYVSLAEIQSSTSLKQQLIDNIMIFENYPVAKYSDKSENSKKLELKMELAEAVEQTNYNFNIIAAISDELLIKLSYNACIYDEQYVNRIAGHIKQIIKEVVENPEIKLSEIEMLSEEEKRKILVDFNDTKKEYPKDKTIYELFEDQVEKTPNNIAVVYEDKKLTYRELNEKSNSLARELREKGVKPDSIVAIMVERSLEMMIGIMGILKAGGAYLPMDPEYPKDRIEGMLEDSNTKILLTQNYLMDKIKFEGIIVDLEGEELFKGSKDNLEKVNTSSDLAYVIYTSGSTGKPKGVMIEHRSILNTILSRKEEYKQTNEDYVMILFSFAFDGFVTSFFTAIVSGSKTLLLNKQEAKDPIEISRKLTSEKITHFITVPSLYMGILHSTEKVMLQNIKVVTLAGEKLTLSTIKKSLEIAPKIEMVNEYGPTENSVLSTMMRNVNLETPISVGKPISNTRIYIVNENNRIQPIGVVGELCISGKGLARGYLNRLKLTEEKFIQNPFESGEKMYRTGDIARWLPDGNIEYIGRTDHQVKIRGYRIELGEIENQLLKNDAIKEAVVIDREDEQSNKYLCAYIACDKEMTVPELRSSLSKELPDYMMPAYFMQIEKMPLTPNGKLDRKALLEPDREINTGVEYVAPRNEIEEKLVKVWTEVLRVEKIGIDDDFFTLGGHSLKAIQVVSIIHRELNVEVPVGTVFSNPTIRGMAEIITNENVNSTNYKKIENTYVLLNEIKDKNIFAFPPNSGNGIVYKYMANLLNEYSLYAFDYIENEDKIAKYVKVIKGIQKEGPYILMAYSAGGRLAFEVAKTLLKDGSKVSGIIMIDSYPLKNDSYIELKEDELGKIYNDYLEDHQNEVNTEIKELFQNTFSRKALIRKVNNYTKYLSNISICREKIKTDIYIIKSEESREKKLDICGEPKEVWDELIDGELIQYFGYGKHSEMISEYGGKNIDIIKGILKIIG
ncbi:non-ribosomal peptide synthetase [Clostridium estertheticum]|uniref:non-ribosomal peptide synthetase n=1 Tax=Clostridium estertheticum TaxID=238834 RepID=UPI001C7CEE87|nr:non-ribosomal peptide synthetase [Clostridium estertheticum]MBX4266311.1 amino acid adenylation domain-containing protein [Clostridium estertheticum]WLC90010.1 amino acid adenylation domain-containing protein [Clostridium estertheticum]